MEFNVKKCTLMFMGRNNRSFQYAMNESKLQVGNFEKNLDVIITDDGKSSKECLNGYNKTVTILGTINRTITYQQTPISVSRIKQ